MEALQEAWQYALNPTNNFMGQVGQHLKLSGIALLIALLIGVPLGIWISRYEALARVVINVLGVLRVVPSLAVLFILLPIMKSGLAPSVTALTILAVPPLLINTDAGMRGVDRAVIEAGRGMGMSAWQLLRKVQLPLAAPVILTGLRISAIEVVASATLATLIGGGGLGDFIQAGLSLSRNDILLVGAIPVAIMALFVELGLSYTQRLALRRRHLSTG
jgi:osmoprotectant transport system permease protein